MVASVFCLSSCKLNGIATSPCNIRICRARRARFRLAKCEIFPSCSSTKSIIWMESSVSTESRICGRCARKKNLKRDIARQARTLQAKLDKTNLAAGKGLQVNEQKVKWGVLGVAAIAVKKVIPAMQKGEWSEIAGIASRDPRKAKDAAAKLDIAKACGSYEELLADPEIEAIYNPLPNHLHVPWSIKAAEAGKHALCDKPISLTFPTA